MVSDQGKYFIVIISFWALSLRSPSSTFSPRTLIWWSSRRFWFVSDLLLWPGSWRRPLLPISGCRRTETLSCLWPICTGTDFPGPIEFFWDRQFGTPSKNQNEHCDLSGQWQYCKMYGQPYRSATTRMPVHCSYHKSTHWLLGISPRQIRGAITPFPWSNQETGPWISASLLYPLWPFLFSLAHSQRRYKLFYHFCMSVWKQ